jgi:hypothetical protein
VAETRGHLLHVTATDTKFRVQNTRAAGGKLTITVFHVKGKKGDKIGIRCACEQVDKNGSS